MERRLACDSAAGDSAPDDEDVEFAMAKGRAPVAAGQRVGLHWIKAKPVSSHAITGRPRTSRRNRCWCPYAVRARRNDPQGYDGDRARKTLRRRAYSTDESRWR